MYYVYILKCSDSSLYTGVTTDLKRRITMHRAGTGAKYTRSRGVHSVVYSERKRSRSNAQKREAEIKGWTRAQKLAFIASQAK